MICKKVYQAMNIYLVEIYLEMRIPWEIYPTFKVEHSPVKVENSAAPTTSQENVDKNRFPVLPEPVEMLRIAMSSAGTKESPTSPKVDDRDV